MKKLSIPLISDEELMRRYLKIKPVVEVQGIKYWLRNYSLNELKSVSYIWSAFPDRRYPIGDSLSNHTHYDFECLHKYGCPGFFKPIIAEVLAQIPEEIFNHYSIDAFEIINWPISSENINKYRKAFEKGFHVSTVRLYIRVMT